MTGCDQGLYDTLSKLRLQLAKQANLPAYTVFNNQTLIQIAETLPQTKEALLNIHGIGPAKWEKYGQLLLDTIIRYCEKNAIVPKEKRSVATQSAELSPLLEKMLNFYRERNWEQFHSPKNLVMDLASEIGELVELFRWLTEEQSYHLDAPTLEDVRDEIGDVFKCLIYLSHKLGIDPIEASSNKLVKMEQKYPAKASYGKALKYTHYQTQEPIEY
jgi:dCTP diphosphatase